MAIFLLLSNSENFTLSFIKGMGSDPCELECVSKRRVFMALNVKNKRFYSFDTTFSLKKTVIDMPDISKVSMIYKHDSDVTKVEIISKVYDNITCTIESLNLITGQREIKQDYLFRKRDWRQKTSYHINAHKNVDEIIVKLFCSKTDVCFRGYKFKGSKYNLLCLNENEFVIIVDDKLRIYDLNGTNMRKIEFPYTINQSFLKDEKVILTNDKRDIILVDPVNLTYKTIGKTPSDNIFPIDEKFVFSTSDGYIAPDVNTSIFSIDGRLIFTFDDEWEQITEVPLTKDMYKEEPKRLGSILAPYIPVSSDLLNVIGKYIFLIN